MGPIFAHTFLVTNGCDAPTLRVVAPEETLLRKKRAHRKSRLGCIRCKRRKVKCDEADPCGNCVKRSERCVRTPPLSRRGDDGSHPLTSVPRDMSWSPFPEPEGVPVNILHMELLHHFEKSTIPTLIFQEIWPTMLQLAFRSQQHTFLVNAMLSFAAAHLAYLVPHDVRYHRAKASLLDKALRDYREALSSPITAENCDALLGGAVLVHHLLWCDLSFMEGQAGNSGQPLDLSADRLYYLSTGQRQIFFMAWPLFQSPKSIFMKVGILQPCMALSDEVDARGLNWRRFSRGFMDLYDNPRYHGGCRALDAFSSPTSAPDSQSLPSSPTTSTYSSSFDISLEDEALGFHSPVTPILKVLTLWQSYKEGEAFVKSGGATNETLTRAAYKRLAERVAIAMAFLADGGFAAGSPAPSLVEAPTAGHSPMFRREHVVRYVMTFAMLCFGPLLPMISSGDSRALFLLYHIYRVVGELLPSDEHWWCRKRVTVMIQAIGDELDARGLEVCLRN